MIVEANTAGRSSMNGVSVDISSEWNNNMDLLDECTSIPPHGGNSFRHAESIAVF
jgi:hypothetical protein